MGASPERDLIFSTSDGIILDPIMIEAEVFDVGEYTVTVQNSNVDFPLEDLGVYLRPSANIGPHDNPAENPPATDYQDIIMWGTRTLLDPTVFEGGVKITFDSLGLEPIWVTRSQGATWSSRIKFGKLESASSSSGDNSLTFT